jgi:hypothetical protein
METMENRHLWQLDIVSFLHRCLTCPVKIFENTVQAPVSLALHLLLVVDPRGEV